VISSPPRYFQDRAHGDGRKRVLMRCIFLVGTALFTDRYVLDGQGDGSSSLIHGASCLVLMADSATLVKPEP
jgi:hypothetical protein